MRPRIGSSPRCRAHRRKTPRRYHSTTRSRTDSGTRPPRGGLLPQSSPWFQTDPDGSGPRRGRELEHTPSPRRRCRLYIQHAEGSRPRANPRRLLHVALYRLHAAGRPVVPGTGGRRRNRVSSRGLVQPTGHVQSHRLTGSYTRWIIVVGSCGSAGAVERNPTVATKVDRPNHLRPTTECSQVSTAPLARISRVFEQRERFERPTGTEPSQAKLSQELNEAFTRVPIS